MQASDGIHTMLNDYRKWLFCGDSCFSNVCLEHISSYPFSGSGDNCYWAIEWPIISAITLTLSLSLSLPHCFRFAFYRSWFLAFDLHFSDFIFRIERAHTRSGSGVRVWALLNCLLAHSFLGIFFSFTRAHSRACSLSEKQIEVESPPETPVRVQRKREKEREREERERGRIQKLA